MQTPPTITLCIPTYNSKFLPQLLKSLEAQTFQSFKVIFVDDCSSDLTWETLCEQRDKYPFPIEIERHLENTGGMGVAVQRTLARCSTPFFTWMACDDELEPKYLETLHRALLQDGNLDYAYTNYLVIDEESKLRACWTWNDISYERLVNHVADTLSGCFPMNGLFRTEFIREHGLSFLLYEGDTFSCDTINSLHFLKAGMKSKVIRRSLFRYRRHTAQNSHALKQRILSDLTVLRYIVCEHFEALDKRVDFAVKYFRDSIDRLIKLSELRFSSRVEEVHEFAKSDEYKDAVTLHLTAVLKKYRAHKT